MVTLCFLGHDDIIQPIKFMVTEFITLRFPGDYHGVKRVRIRCYSGPHFSRIFS